MGVGRVQWQNLMRSTVGALGSSAHPQTKRTIRIIPTAISWLQGIQPFRNATFSNYAVRRSNKRSLVLVDQEKAEGQIARSVCLPCAKLRVLRGRMYIISCVTIHGCFWATFVNLFISIDISFTIEIVLKNIWISPSPFNLRSTY